MWHFRLGHPSDSRLYLADLHHEFGAKGTRIPCSICPLAKLHRLPFSISQSRSEKCFDLIHCDLWRPCTNFAYDGSKYFLSIVDDHSRCTWIYLLKLKSDALIILQTFYTMIETQFHSKIKVIRTDNGKEFNLKKIILRKE